MRELCPECQQPCSALVRIPEADGVLEWCEACEDSVNDVADLMEG